jgi:uncharacterized protein YlxP (DUF503 family)
MGGFDMFIGTVKITLYASWVHSLKEKRMIVKSLCAKIRNQFNVSVVEIEEQDIHQTIVIAVACVTGVASLADSVIENVIEFVEDNTEAQITNIEKELR